MGQCDQNMVENLGGKMVSPSLLTCPLTSNTHLWQAMSVCVKDNLVEDPGKVLIGGPVPILINNNEYHCYINATRLLL